MVKRRNTNNPIQNAATQDEINQFINAADQNSDMKKSLNPNAARDYKAIRVPFNEYEFTLLNEVSKQTGRSKLNTIRWAILKLSEQLKD